MEQLSNTNGEMQQRILHRLDEMRNLTNGELEQQILHLVDEMRNLTNTVANSNEKCDGLGYTTTESSQGNYKRYFTTHYNTKAE